MPTLITPHFSLEEAACHDGTPYPVDQIDEVDPLRRTWRESRLLPQALMLEKIRARALAAAQKRGRTIGGVLLVISWFRSLAYDQKIYDESAKDGSVAKPSRSQHPEGRATDFRHTSGGLSAVELFNLILEMYAAGEIPELGGLGLYPSFVHVDTRPKVPAGHLAIWGGERPENVA